MASTIRSKNAVTFVLFWDGDPRSGKRRISRVELQFLNVMKRIYAVIPENSRRGSMRQIDFRAKEVWDFEGKGERIISAAQVSVETAKTLSIVAKVFHYHRNNKLPSKASSQNYHTEYDQEITMNSLEYRVGQTCAIVLQVKAGGITGSIQDYFDFKESICSRISFKHLMKEAVEFWNELTLLEVNRCNEQFGFSSESEATSAARRVQQDLLEKLGTKWVSKFRVNDFQRFINEASNFTNVGDAGSDYDIVLPWITEMLPNCLLTSLEIAIKACVNVEGFRAAFHAAKTFEENGANFACEFCLSVLVKHLLSIKDFESAKEALDAIPGDSEFKDPLVALYLSKCGSPLDENRSPTSKNKTTLATPDTSVLPASKSEQEGQEIGPSHSSTTKSFWSKHPSKMLCNIL